MALARSVRVLPVIENGSIVGMRLGGGAQSPLVARLGLGPDDIVTAVNGISVRDVGRAQQILASVRDADRVSVTVRRNGQEVDLPLLVAELPLATPSPGVPGIPGPLPASINTYPADTVSPAGGEFSGNNPPTPDAVSVPPATAPQP